MISIEELKAIREKMQGSVDLRNDTKGTRIVVGMATCGIAAGARPVLQALTEEVSKRQLKDVMVTQTGCIGICRLEPIVEVYEGDTKTTYVKMTAEKAKQVVASHIVNHQVVTEYTIGANE
jgi:NADP-reducing hydrogenase subunit HndB